MALRRLWLFAAQTLAGGLIAVAAISPAAAQGFTPAPSQGFAAPAQQEPPCYKDFTALRGDIEKKANAIRASSARRPSPQEGCRLLTSLSAAEDKLIKYTAANSTWCGIPPTVLTQIKEAHVRTADLRTRVCDVAARPPQAAPGPSLSDALGTNAVPDAGNIKTGRGTYDTLTGTPLGK